MSTLGERIKALREALELSQQAAADEAGITQEHWCNIELGNRNPSIESLPGIARTLGVSQGDLLDSPRKT